MIFPEGTRTVPGQPMQMQRGAANVALRGARVLTPVFITCDPPTLSKNLPWYRIPPRRPTFTLRAGDDIDLEAYRRRAIADCVTALEFRPRGAVRRATPVRDYGPEFQGPMKSREEIFDTVRSALVELFELEAPAIVPEARFDDDLEIDSIDAVDLIEHLSRIFEPQGEPARFPRGAHRTGPDRHHRPTPGT